MPNGLTNLLMLDLHIKEYAKKGSAYLIQGRSEKGTYGWVSESQIEVLERVE